MIRGDSTEYDLLGKWANFDCQGYNSVEIGVREGLGTKVILDNIKNNYIHIGIDPYADLEYQHTDNDAETKWNGKSTPPTYSDAMRDTMLNDFKWYRNQGRFSLANMPDYLFMTNPSYNEKIYAFVHFDGPHTTKAVITEAVWFANRSAPHTRFVFDDYDVFDMQLIINVLDRFGFKPIEKGNNKILLEKNGSDN